MKNITKEKLRRTKRRSDSLNNIAIVTENRSEITALLVTIDATRMEYVSIFPQANEISAKLFLAQLRTSQHVVRAITVL